MEDSEDNMSADDTKNNSSRSGGKVKPKKRSLVERELETSLTEQFISPINNRDGLSKSRYGRARRLKTDTNFCDTDKAISEVLKTPQMPNVDKTPVKSPPAYKMHASNSPVRKETPKKLIKGHLENQIENIYNTNISLSRFGSSEASSTTPAKKFPKIYTRKDLIQSKEKDETISAIKNLFSPANSSQKTNSHLSNVLERSSEKYNINSNVSQKQNGFFDNSSVVKTLDFDAKKKKDNKDGSQVLLSKNELFELEAKCMYQVGDLAWARLGTFPFWPCIITREPYSSMFVKKKLFGQKERDIIHITFFGDNGRRSWVLDSLLRPFLGLQEFETTRDQFTAEAKKKDPRLYGAFFISDKKKDLWKSSVEEAETLMREPKRLRVDIFYNMLEKSRINNNKGVPKLQNQRGNRLTRTNSDVSLSESLYDSLFSEDDYKIDDPERSAKKSKNKSLDVSEVVTACLDNMAAKTGITKIQRQSHMDRWLQKAKSKTPEKNQLKITVTVEKLDTDEEKFHEKEELKKKEENEVNELKSKKKRKKFPPRDVPKTPSPYSFRKTVRESHNLLSHQNEHDYSKSPEKNDIFHNISSAQDTVDLNKREESVNVEIPREQVGNLKENENVNNIENINNQNKNEATLIKNLGNLDMTDVNDKINDELSTGSMEVDNETPNHEKSEETISDLNIDKKQKVSTKLREVKIQLGNNQDVTLNKVIDNSIRKEETQVPSVEVNELQLEAHPVNNLKANNMNTSTDIYKGRKKTKRGKTKKVFADTQVVDNNSQVEKIQDVSAKVQKVELETQNVKNLESINMGSSTETQDMGLKTQQIQNLILTLDIKDVESNVQKEEKNEVTTEAQKIELEAQKGDDLGFENIETLNSDSKKIKKNYSGESATDEINLLEETQHTDNDISSEDTINMINSLLGESDSFDQDVAKVETSNNEKRNHNVAVVQNVLNGENNSNEIAAKDEKHIIEIIGKNKICNKLQKYTKPLINKKNGSKILRVYIEAIDKNVFKKALIKDIKKTDNMRGSKINTGISLTKTVKTRSMSAEKPAIKKISLKTRSLSAEKIGIKNKFDGDKRKSVTETSPAIKKIATVKTRSMSADKTRTGFDQDKQENSEEVSSSPSGESGNINMSIDEILIEKRIDEDSKKCAMEIASTSNTEASEMSVDETVIENEMEQVTKETAIEIRATTTPVKENMSVDKTGLKNTGTEDIKGTTLISAITDGKKISIHYTHENVTNVDKKVSVADISTTSSTENKHMPVSEHVFDNGNRQNNKKCDATATSIPDAEANQNGTSTNEDEHEFEHLDILYERIEKTEAKLTTEFCAKNNENKICKSTELSSKPIVEAQAAVNSTNEVNISTSKHSTPKKNLSLRRSLRKVRSIDKDLKSGEVTNDSTVINVENKEITFFAVDDKLNDLKTSGVVTTEMSTDSDITDCSVATFYSDAKKGVTPIETIDLETYAFKNESLKNRNEGRTENIDRLQLEKPSELEKAVINGVVDSETDNDAPLKDAIDVHGAIKGEKASKDIENDVVNDCIVIETKKVEVIEINDDEPAENESYDESDYSDDDDIERPPYSPHIPEAEREKQALAESLASQNDLEVETTIPSIKSEVSNEITPQIESDTTKEIKIVSVTSVKVETEVVKSDSKVKTEFDSDNDSLSSECDNIALSELKNKYDSMSSEFDDLALSELKKAIKSKRLRYKTAKSKIKSPKSKGSSDTDVTPKRELRSSRISKSPSVKHNGIHSTIDIKPECVTKQENDTASVISINSDSESNSSKQKGPKEMAPSTDNMKHPEFLNYLHLRLDTLIDQHPELTHDEIVAYLYKTWQYEERKKSDLMKDDDTKLLEFINGIKQEPTHTKKKVLKQRKVLDIVKVMNKSDYRPREKRKNQSEVLYKEDFSDLEDEIEMFEIFKPKIKVRNSNESSAPKAEPPKIEPSASPKADNCSNDETPMLAVKAETQDAAEINKAHTAEVLKIIEVKSEVECEFKSEVKSEVKKDETTEMKAEEPTAPVDEYYDEEEAYFEQLTTPKPNAFKGFIREKVCGICEKTGNLVKCKGCYDTFHVECVNKKTEEQVPTPPTRGRKKKKKNLRFKDSNESNGVDSGSQSDDKPQDPNVSEEMNMSVDSVTDPEPIIIDLDAIEEQFETKMKELIASNDVVYECYSSDDGITWENTQAGKCEIVDIKIKQNVKIEEVDYSDFKCKNCKKYDTPICFVCKSAVSPKDKTEKRQKCQVMRCQKYYHVSCLDHWPQTQFSSGEPSRSKKVEEHFEALTCPRHVCHTCVCDDPRGCKTRFSADKLARCVRCPATYHSFTKCLPAGSKILSASHIICPRHYEHRPGKIPCHVNTGWCFICALGGTLICCEYCPTSFHADCLNIEPPEGNYMCEDCETGRLPLYGEMVWVKLGHYRWWPGIILHPSEIPDNIMAVKHALGEFVVRFFGQYDHYWVNRGRVFPFQEGDSGRISGQKSKIDEAFIKAMDHAKRAFEILKNVETTEEDPEIASSLLPPHYVKLKVNKPCGSLYGKRIDIDQSSLTQCECNPDEEEPCGPYSHCLNRMLLTECGPLCRAGERCQNRLFERRAYPRLTPYRTPHRGWGLRTLEPIKAGQFVIEYVGELIDEEEFRRRMRRKHEMRDENFYFLTLDKERMIDAGPKGNLARFMNHCCEPNCETQKWTVLGDVRVGLFAIKDIPANSEVTFNYNLECAGIEKKRCLCGAKRCSGYIGAKPKQEETQPKKSKDKQKIKIKINIKRKYNKKEKILDDRMKPKRPVGRPAKPRELTEIEKDLLIIKNATNGLSSDSETSSRLSSTDGERSNKSLKRKRGSFSTEETVCNNSPSVKKTKLDEGKVSEVGD